MKAILIATDFSTAARNATRYGFEFAKAIRAKVVLFTAHPGSPDDFSFSKVEKYCYGRLVTEAETFDPLGRVALETQCHQGHVTSSILSVAAENNASFIIVGMKGRGKEIRRFLAVPLHF